MEGKGETRLRNEQASENKVESQIPSKKRGKNKKRNYYFFAETGFFQKTCFGYFKLRSGDFDLFNLRAPPFPFLVLTVTAAPAGVFCLPDPGYLRGRSGSTVLVRLRGARDGSSAHQPITTSHPNHFRPLVDFAGNAEEREGGAAPSDFHLALRLFPVSPSVLPYRSPAIHHTIRGFALNTCPRRIASALFPTSSPFRVR